MNLCKKMISALAAVALTASVSLSAMAVTAGYSDYGKSDVVAVTPDKKVELVAQGTDSNGSALSTGVKVEIPAGMLPENVTQVSMEVGAVADADVSAAVDEAESKGYDDLKVLDIRLLDQNGNPITQLNGAVSVTVPASGSQNAVLYVSDDHKITDMNAVLSGGYLTFETDHFSYYAAAEKKNAVSGPATGDTGTTVIVVAVMSAAAVGVVLLSMKARKAGAR